MAKKATPNKENLILTLEQTLGVVSIACKKAEIGRSTHYRWYKEDPEYKARVDEVRDLALDFVESRLFKRIAENSDTMIMYYLNNHGASRGYGHRGSGHRSNGHKSIDPNAESEVVIRIIREERKRDE